MPRLLRPDLHPGLQLLLLAGLLLAGLSLGSLVALTVAGPLLGVGAAQVGAVLASPAAHPGAWGFVMVYQGLAMAGLGAGAAVLPRLLGAGWLGYFAPARPARAAQLLGAAGLMVSLIPLLSVVVAWNAGVHFPAALHDFEEWARAKEDQAAALTQYLTHFPTVGRLLLALLVVAVLPAVAEELTFRGVVQRNLVRWLGSRHAGVWLAAAVFSAIHVQFFGFVPRFVLGLVLGYLYEWSGNIAVPMAAHFTQNATQLVLVYLAQHGFLGWDFDPDSTEALAWPWVLGSGIVVALLVWVLSRGQATKTLSSKGVVT